MALVSGDPPAGALEERGRVAVEVAAAAQPQPEGGDRIDRGVAERPTGTGVLQQEESPAGAQHAPELGKGREEQRRGDRAEHERGDDRIEGGVGKRQRRGGRPREGVAAFPGARPGGAQQGGRGLDARDARARPVMAQVEAGADPDLQDVLGQVAHEPPPQSPHPRQAEGTDERVVDRRRLQDPTHMPILLQRHDARNDLHDAHLVPTRTPVRLSVGRSPT